MIKLSYIMSGCSHTRINYKAEDYTREKIKGCISKLQLPSHDFGLLYNAWTESKFGPTFNSHYSNSASCIMADSGGLQIVTQGKQITPEMKLKVYENQALHSTYGMCFDEIPVSFSGDRSERFNEGNRWFDRNKFEHCARETGRNLKAQIVKFIELKSTCKPILIAQGSDLDTYTKWTELVLEEIPRELQPYIKGVAMGAAALGNGLYEDIVRGFFYTQLPIKSNHMHLLAIGSTQRIVPYLIFLRSGLYNKEKDFLLSYDSTSHSSGVNYGRYFLKEGNWMDITRVMTPEYNTIHGDLVSYFNYEYTVEEFHEALNTSHLKLVSKKKHGQDLGIMSFSCFVFASAYNFINSVNELMNSKPHAFSVIAEKAGVPYSVSSNLMKIKTLDDFLYWDKHVGKPYIKSKAIATEQPASLGDLLC